ncbi:hypothetical protein LBMAG27_03780 [Bacteroidota bacterium]|nr:hypothetical protein LBMAG27_03780 [Bacteroidota bacterium]
MGTNMEVSHDGLTSLFFLQEIATIKRLSVANDKMAFVFLNIQKLNCKVVNLEQNMRSD